MIIFEAKDKKPAFCSGGFRSALDPMKNSVEKVSKSLINALTLKNRHLPPPELARFFWTLNPSLS